MDLIRKKEKPGLIVVQAVLMVWFIVLAFCEPDYKGALQIVIGVVTLIVTAIGIFFTCRKKFIWVIVILLTELVLAIIWTKGMWTDRVGGEELVQISEEVSTEETKRNGTDIDGGEREEKELKDFDLKSDFYLKNLDEYTNVDGTENEKITKVMEEKLRHWMKEYDTLRLGGSSDECARIRGKADEIYTICCLPQKDSKYLQDKAVESYDDYIKELEELYNKSENPEIKKEIASAYIDLGDLYQTLGNGDKARNCYSKVIEVGWDGVKMSIKYGMKTKVKEIFGILSKSYENISTLSVVDEWDRERAKTISKIFNELAESFDPEFLSDI